MLYHTFSSNLNKLLKIEVLVINIFDYRSPSKLFGAHLSHLNERFNLYCHKIIGAVIPGIGPQPLPIIGERVLALLIAVFNEQRFVPGLSTASLRRILPLYHHSWPKTTISAQLEIHKNEKIKFLQQVSF